MIMRKLLTCLTFCALAACGNGPSPIAQTCPDRSDECAPLLAFCYEPGEDGVAPWPECNKRGSVWCCPLQDDGGVKGCESTVAGNACTIANCDGVCNAAVETDAGIAPGLCVPVDGCVSACKTAADCEAHHELPTCYVYGCHPGGGFGNAGGLDGCVLRAEPNGTPCDFPGDNADAGVCQSGSCWATEK